VEKCDKFLFWSKVEAAYGLETVITVITVIDSPYMDVSLSSSSSSSSPSCCVRVVESESLSSNSSRLISGLWVLTEYLCLFSRRVWHC
jgi:hypothetical protein